MNLPIFNTAGPLTKLSLVLLASLEFEFQAFDIRRCTFQHQVIECSAIESALWPLEALINLEFRLSFEPGSSRLDSLNLKLNIRNFNLGSLSKLSYQQKRLHSLSFNLTSSATALPCLLLFHSHLKLNFGVKY